MEGLSTALRRWYKHHKRDLPWRHTTDPYIIWLSEIILQQTRVDQGLPYFQQFTNNFTNVKQLAAASEEKILKLWQGLGYYSRARNLHHAAKTVVQEMDGKFPHEYVKLLKLKGVGEYTAAAIASFSSGEKVPVVDGNVLRFLARYFGETTPIDTAQGKKIFKELAYSILPDKQIDVHNQAIMEFGALQCKPSNPDCAVCPFLNSCVARKTATIGQLPVKSKSVKVKSRYFNYLVLTEKEFTYLEKRNSGDIWQGLYQFPLIETEQSLSISKLLSHPSLKEVIGTRAPNITLSPQFVHKLTHQTIYASFLRLELKLPLKVSKRAWKRINKRQIQQYPVPRLIEKYLEQHTI